MNLKMSQRAERLVRSRVHPASPVMALVIGLGLLGMVATAAVGYATRIGPWAHSDGVGYIMLARNMLAGRGLGLMRASGEFQSLSMHPPLYPLSLVAVGLTGAELLTAARWLDAALFTISVVMVGIIVFYVSRMAWLGVAAAAIFLLTPSLVTIYTGAMSEPLYFAMSLASLCLILFYFNSGRLSTLAAAAILAGLTVVTRYLGVTFVAAMVAGLLLFGEKDRRKRLLDMGLFVGLAAVPVVVWFAWINTQAGSDAPRQWLWDMTDLWARTEPIRGGLVSEFWDWIPFAKSIDAVPYRYQLRILIVAGFGFTTILLITARKIRSKSSLDLKRDPAWQLISIMTIFTLAYLVLLSGVFLFGRPPLDASDIDQRILTPVYVAILLSAFALVPLFLRAWPERRWVMASSLILIALVFAWFSPRSWVEIRRLNASSDGLTGRTWLASETLESARTLPANISIITNESTAMMFHNDRPSYDVPELLRAEPQLEFLRFGDGQAGEERIFREEGAALILFDSVYWQLRGIYDERAEARLESMVDGLELYADLRDGAIYFYP